MDKEKLMEAIAVATFFKSAADTIQDTPESEFKPGRFKFGISKNYHVHLLLVSKKYPVFFWVL
jgi:hypothetical protein